MNISTTTDVGSCKLLAHKFTDLYLSLCLSAVYYLICKLYLNCANVKMIQLNPVDRNSLAYIHSVINKTAITNVVTITATVNTHSRFLECLYIANFISLSVLQHQSSTGLQEEPQVRLSLYLFSSGLLSAFFVIILPL